MPDAVLPEVDAHGEAASPEPGAGAGDGGDAGTADRAILFTAVPTAVFERPGDPSSLEMYGVTVAGHLVRVPGPEAPATLFEDLGSPAPPVAGDTLGVLGTPAAVSLEPGRVDVFVRATDRRFWQRARRDVWHAWGWFYESFVDSDPAAASWGPERIDLFARGAADGQLVHIFYDKGWADWESLGKKLASAPAVTSASFERLDIVARDESGAILHLGFNRAWSPWSSLGGATRVAPSALSRRRGVAEIYMAEDTGRLKVMQILASGPTEWKDAGLAVSGEFRAVAVSPTRVLVLTLDARGALELRTIDYPDDSAPGSEPRDAGADASTASNFEMER
jgi:hypothetical protein